MSGEIYSYIYDKLLSEGALDVYTQSIFMKKNRPATKLSILCAKKDRKKFVEMILKETSTFGVRYIEYKRSAIERQFTEINTEYGLISIKLGYYKGKLIKFAPEYEDCKKIAEKTGLPLIAIFDNINSRIIEEIDENLLT